MERKLLIAGVLLLLIAGLGAFFFFENYTGGFSLSAPIIVTIIIIAFLVIMIVLKMSRRSDSGTGSISARHILDERYARGEITDSEYRTKIEELNR